MGEENDDLGALCYWMLMAYYFRSSNKWTYCSKFHLVFKTDGSDLILVYGFSYLIE